MKFIQIFTKTPGHKRFNYTPRHFDPQEEERRERENRIRHELQKENEQASAPEDDSYGYRKRMAGSFRNAKKTAPVQSDPSASMLRLIVLLVLAVGLIAFLEFGNTALYAVALVFIPIYIYLKFRKTRGE